MARVLRLALFSIALTLSVTAVKLNLQWVCDDACLVYIDNKFIASDGIWADNSGVVVDISAGVHELQALAMNANGVGAIRFHIRNLETSQAVVMTERGNTAGWRAFEFNRTTLLPETSRPVGICTGINDLYYRYLFGSIENLYRNVSVEAYWAGDCTSPDTGNTAYYFTKQFAVVDPKSGVNSYDIDMSIVNTFSTSRCMDNGESSDVSESSLSKGAQAGIAIGVIGALSLVGATFLVVRERKSRKKYEDLPRMSEVSKEEQARSPVSSIVVDQSSMNMSQNSKSLSPKTTSSQKVSLPLHLQLNMDEDFKVKEPLDSFEFGTWYTGNFTKQTLAVQFNGGNERILVKNYRRTTGSSGEEKDLVLFTNEVLMLTRIKNQSNIVKMLAFAQNSRSIIFAGKSHRILSACLADKSFMPEERYFDISMFVALEIVDAVNFLHSHEIVHRDINTDNILLEIDDEAKVSVKLADFQWSLFCPSTHTRTTSTSASSYPDDLRVDYYIRDAFTARSQSRKVRFLSAELLTALDAKTPFNDYMAMDVYALSVTLIEVLTRQVTWSEEQPDTIRLGIMDGQKPGFDSVDEAIKPIIESGLEPSEKRLKVSDLLERLHVAGI